ncbi:hypothetical protein NHF46_00250 [Arthrobacter alpinus]|nr:hypothetical protein [Arthrobacter alpinus]
MSKHVAAVSIAPAGENRAARQVRRRNERSVTMEPKLSLRELREQRAAENAGRGVMPDWGKRGGVSLWGPHRVHPAPHRASTMTMAAAYPFLTESGLGSEGTYIGTDLFGSGAFLL